MNLAHSKPRAIYEIQVQGALDPGWQQWLSGLAITFNDSSERPATTTLVGPVADQAALRGLLCKLWDLNLTLVSVRRAEAGEKEGEAHD
jgi:hypothetical protein